MSTTPSGPPVAPATSWYPNLKNSGLSIMAQNSIMQSYRLIYSLRDTVNQQSGTVGKLIQFGTHLDRVNTQAQAMPESMLWFESDRLTVFYQTRLNPPATTMDWFYAGGMYYDVMANRPTDLGLVKDGRKGDIGFLFLASDTHALYAWNGKGASGTDPANWDQVNLAGGGGGGGGGGITTQNVVTANRAIGAVYQNTTGKAMVVMATVNIGSASPAVVQAQSDGSNPPTTNVGYWQIYNTPSTTVAITFVVLSGNFYKVGAYGGAGPPVILCWTEWY